MYCLIFCMFCSKLLDAPFDVDWRSTCCLMWRVFYILKTLKDMVLMAQL